MKAVRINNPGNVELIDIPIPSCGKSEVLIKVNSLGLCGSDLKTYLGDNPMVKFPCIPGHEIAGEIVEIGSDVPPEMLNRGPVTVMPYSACGECVSCLQERYNCCEFNQTLGIQRDGAASEYISIDYKKVLFADGLSEEEVALIEPLSVGFHAVGRANPRQNSFLLVFGCGLIGLGVIIAAAEKGTNVIAVDIDDEKLELSQKMGARYTLNSIHKDFKIKLAAITGNKGPEYVIEGVGIPATYKAAIDLVSYAGTVVYIGYVKNPVEFETKLFVSKELNILGSRNALRADFEKAAAVLQSKRLDTSPLVSRRFNIEKANEAFEYWESNRKETIKILLKMNKQ